MHHSSRRKHIKHVHRAGHLRRQRYFTSQQANHKTPFASAEQVPSTDLTTDDELVFPVDKTG